MHPLSCSSDVLGIRDIRESDNIPLVTERGRGSADLGLLLNDTSINDIGDLRELASKGVNSARVIISCFWAGNFVVVLGCLGGGVLSDAALMT